jgi:DNA repair exonuclease SbcCD ATPase subunit
MNLIQYKEKVTQLKGNLSFFKMSLEAKTLAIKDKEDNLQYLEKAQVFLQKVAKETQDQLRYHIEDIVQLCLDTCWPDQVQFQVSFKLNRGKTEAKLTFIIDGEEVDVIDADGGGMVDVVAFALRITTWTLKRSRNTIILDEPFKHLSDDLQPRAAEILHELSEKLKLQFIMVTHRKEITAVADRIIEVSRKRDGDYWKSVIEIRE